MRKMKTMKKITSLRRTGSSHKNPHGDPLLRETLKGIL
jgi:hypothetical protein